jgi:hypothetical protein
MAEQIRVVELVLRDHDTGVGVRGDGEVAGATNPVATSGNKW